MTVDICKLLVLDYLKSSISAKFAEKSRQKLAIPADAQLPSDHPSIDQIFELVNKNSKGELVKRKYESSGSEEEEEDEIIVKTPAKKVKKNGSVDSSRSSKDSSYESETEEFVNKASGFENNQSAGANCFNCKKPGHYSRDCSEESAMKCFNCEKTGHLSRDCPDKRNATGSVCFSCNQTGHFSRDCPEKMSGTRCFNCQQNGHMSRECPTGRSGGRGAGGRSSYSATGSNSVPLGTRSAC